MFLIQRKADGKFYRNRGYSQRTMWGRPEDDALWSSDPNECKPFLTAGAAKQSAWWKPYADGEETNRVVECKITVIEEKK